MFKKTFSFFPGFGLMLLISLGLQSAALQAWADETGPEGNTGTAGFRSAMPAEPWAGGISAGNPGTTQDSGYASLGGKIQSLAGRPAFFSAVHGGWKFTPNAYLGLGAYALHAPKDQLNPGNDDNYRQSAMFYGGLEGGYCFFLGEHFTLRPQLLLGLTSTNYFNTTNWDGKDHLDVSSNDSMLMEPGVYADFRFWRGLGISCGVHYHYTLGAEGPEGLTQSSLNQPGLELALHWSGD